MTLTKYTRALRSIRAMALGLNPGIVAIVDDVLGRPCANCGKVTKHATCSDHCSLVTIESAFDRMAEAEDEAICGVREAFRTKPSAEGVSGRSN